MTGEFWKELWRQRSVTNFIPYSALYFPSSYPIKNQAAYDQLVYMNDLEIFMTSLPICLSLSRGMDNTWKKEKKFLQDDQCLFSPLKMLFLSYDPGSPTFSSPTTPTIPFSFYFLFHSITSLLFLLFLPFSPSALLASSF